MNACYKKYPLVAHDIFIKLISLTLDFQELNY